MYPAVELLTGLLFPGVLFRFGLTGIAFKWAIFLGLACCSDNHGPSREHSAGLGEFFGVGVGLLFSFFTKPRMDRIMDCKSLVFDFPPPQPVLSFVDAFLGALVGSGLLWW